jgi:hypothetical protein
MHTAVGDGGQRNYPRRGSLDLQPVEHVPVGPTGAGDDEVVLPVDPFESVEVLADVTRVE